MLYIKVFHLVYIITKGGIYNYLPYFIVEENRMRLFLETGSA